MDKAAHNAVGVGIPVKHSPSPNVVPANSSYTSYTAHRCVLATAAPKAAAPNLATPKNSRSNARPHEGA
jgi:hypothetical protein